MRTRYVIALVLCIIVSAFLGALVRAANDSASSVASKTATPTPTATPTTSPTPTATATPTPTPKPPIRIYPQIGYKPGVHQEGHSLVRAPFGNGVRYICNDNLRTVRADYVGTLDYNGAIIRYEDTSTAIRLGKKGHKKTVYDQDYITLKFDGDGESLEGFGVDTVSMIVTIFDPYVPTDMRVVSLTNPSWDWITRGIRLYPGDFNTHGSGEIRDVKFCVKKH
jgi:hypothetical protein